MILISVLPSELTEHIDCHHEAAAHSIKGVLIHVGVRHHQRPISSAFHTISQIGAGKLSLDRFDSFLGDVCAVLDHLFHE